MRYLLHFAAGCLALTLLACNSSDKPTAPPVPASSDPTGKDLVQGAIVIAPETSGGVRIYKITKVIPFPPPMSDEIVLTAYNEKGNDFGHAAALWRQGKLTIAVVRGRVNRNSFRKRDYRIIDRVAITEADHNAKPSPAPRGR